MNTQENKKVYSKPEIAEMGRLDRFVNDTINANINDGVKYYLPKGGYIIMEKNS